MAKRNDGNEEDLRVRPRRRAKALTQDNPFTGERPAGTEPCAPYGEQTDIPAPPPVVVDTPSARARYDWSDLTDLCPGGMDIRSLNEIIMEILKGHFADPQYIVNDVLKQYVYTDDPATTKIRIVMNTSFNIAQQGLLPAIVVKRGQQRMERKVIGDVADPEVDGLTQYSRIWMGVHQVMVLGQVDGQVEDLALEVLNLFNCLSPVIRTDLPFLDFQVSDTSELGIVEDLGQTLGVAIQLQYIYEYGWTVQRNAPNLRNVNVATTTDLQVQELP